MEELTTKQVAEILGISVRMVVSLIRRNRIAAERTGRDWFITRKEAERVKAMDRPPGRPRKPAADSTAKKPRGRKGKSS